MYDDVIETGDDPADRSTAPSPGCCRSRGECVREVQSVGHQQRRGVVEAVTGDAHGGVEAVDAVEAHDLVAGLSDGGLDGARERRRPSEQEHRLARSQHTLDLGERARVERGRPCEQQRRALGRGERRAASASGKVSARASTTALAVPTPGKLDCEIAFAVSMRSAPEMRVIVLLDGLTTIGAVMFVLGFEK